MNPNTPLNQAGPAGATRTQDPAHPEGHRHHGHRTQRWRIEPTRNRGALGLPPAVTGCPAVDMAVGQGLFVYCKNSKSGGQQHAGVLPREWRGVEDVKNFSYPPVRMDRLQRRMALATLPASAVESAPRCVAFSRAYTRIIPTYLKVVEEVPDDLRTTV